jgi:O-antigen/teichoic acid export membrane protein
MGDLHLHNGLFDVMPKKKSMKLHYWLRDNYLRRLFQNATVLLGGDVLSSVLGLLSLMLTARALGPEAFGILALVKSYVLIIDRLINFQSWQAIIKYGIETLEKRENSEFKALIKWGTLLDLTSAILGTLVAASVAYWAGQYFAWDGQTKKMAIVYSLVILFHLAGTPTAILRILDMFKLFSIQRVLVSIIKFVAILIVFLACGGLWAFLIVWMITEIVGHLILFIIAWREMYRQGIMKTAGGKLRTITKRHTGLWTFAWTTNLHSSVRMSSREFDILIVNMLLGPAAVGLYKVAKQFSTIVGRLTDPLYQAIYPDLARLWANGHTREFKRLIFRAGIIAGCGAFLVWVAFILLGEYILQFTVGADYISAHSVLVLYMLATTIAVFGFPLHPAFLAIGRPRLSFSVLAISTCLYFIVLIPLIEGFGIDGAGLAYIVFYGVWAFCLGTLAAFAMQNRTVPSHVSSI